MTGPKNTAINGALLYLRILSKLSVHRKYSSADILTALKADGVEIEKRALQRALQTMVASGELPIECDDASVPYGYKLTRQAAHMRFGELSANDLLLLRLAKENLRYQLPPKLMQSMAGLFDDADYFFADRSDNPNAAWLKKVRVVNTSMSFLPPKIKPDILEAVSDALYDNTILRIDYVNKERQKLSARVKPVALVQQGVRLYLVCQFEGYDNYRHLALHRMTRAERTGFSFEPPADFNLEKYDAEGHFGWCTGKKVKLEMDVVRWLADDLLETPLSKDQTLDWAADGETAHVTATLFETGTMTWWLRGLGDNVANVSVTDADQSAEQPNDSTTDGLPLHS